MTEYARVHYIPSNTEPGEEVFRTTVGERPKMIEWDEEAYEKSDLAEAERRARAAGIDIAGCRIMLRAAPTEERP